MSKVTTTWKDVKDFLISHDLTDEQNVQLLNLVNKQIFAFPLENLITFTNQNTAVLANGQSMTPEQKESFLQSLRAMKDNKVFQVIADQVLFSCLEVGIHNATKIEHLYFSKAGIYFIREFKKWLDKLYPLA